MDLLYVFYGIISWAFGLCIGSFLNVLIYRLPRDLSIITPRSHCTQCHHSIRWYENIPLLSYFWLKGQCASCKAHIGFRYPLVEFLTGLLFFTFYHQMGWGPELWFRLWPFAAILIAVTFIDIDFRIIPDQLSLGGLVLGLVTSGLAQDGSVVQSFLGAGLGFGFFWILSTVYERATGRIGLGGGDVKLLGMIGAFLGPLGVLSTMLVSSIAGGLFGILMAFLDRKEGFLQVAIPYGPFLALAAFYDCFAGDGLWSLFLIPG